MIEKSFTTSYVPFMNICDYFSDKWVVGFRTNSFILQRPVLSTTLVLGPVQILMI